MIVVDRIEDGFAVVYSGNARKDIPLSELPQGVHEGSILREVPEATSLTRRRSRKGAGRFLKKCADCLSRPTEQGFR